jgi:hypothetical protein
MACPRVSFCGHVAKRGRVNWRRAVVHFDPKAAEQLIKTIGLTDEDKKKFAQTFLGSLLGQSVFLVALLVSYFVALGLVLRFNQFERI